MSAGDSAGAVFDAATARASEDRGYVFGNELSIDDERFDDELVEGLLGTEGMGVLYGDSNTGKTFLAIELASANATGRDFLGKRTRGPGLVLYVASEAPGGAKLRFKAWRRRVGSDLENIVIVTRPVNFFNSDGDDDWLIEVAHAIEKERGQKVVLVIGDTLARIAAGAKENTEDMGQVFARAERVHRALACAFLWVHHIGKDAAKGMRGWSGMRAFIDSEFEIVCDEATGIRTLEVTKQRDLPGKGTRLGFRLAPVAMGTTRWGGARTTCVIEGTDAPPKPSRKRESATAGAIVEFLTSRRSGCTLGGMVRHFEGRIHRSNIYREASRMVDDGTLIRTGAVVALPGAPVTP